MHLSRLIEEASSGKEVIIVSSGEPVAKLVSIAANKSAGKKMRVPGTMAGQITYSEDAFDALTETELADLGFESDC